MNKLLSLFLLIYSISLLYSCASSRKASYYYTQKKIEHGVIDFHRHLQVDEYINAFPQENLPLPEDGKPMALSLSYLSNSKDKNLLQIAITSRMAMEEEKNKTLGLSLVLDTSGSMEADNKMIDALKGLVSIVMELPEKTEFSLVTFDDVPTLLIPPTIISRENRNDVVTTINQIRPGAGTDIQKGLIKGYQAMSKFAPGTISRLILITDGQSDVSISKPSELAKAAEVKFSKNNLISAIGIGEDVNEDVLRKIAADGGGSYYFADKAITLARLLREDLRTFMVPVAKKVKLRISKNEHVSIKRIYGLKDLKFNDNKSISLDIGDLNVNDWRVYIAEVGDISGIDRPITAKLEYHLPNKAKLNEVIAIDDIFDKSENAIRPLVARNAVIFADAMALIDASKLYEEGRKNEALRIIDLQLKNIRVVQIMQFDKHLISEEVTLLKVRSIIEGVANEQPNLDRELKQQYEELMKAPMPEKKQAIKNTIGDVIDLVKQVVPGPWSLLASLFYNAFVK